MAHPLVLALFPSPAAAAVGARALHGAGVTRDQISVITRNHDEDSALAKQMDATPGVDIEDSPSAARVGELSGHVLAAIALVLPGIGRSWLQDLWRPGSARQPATSPGDSRRR
jgi:hypothetical protein